MVPLRKIWLAIVAFMALGICSYAQTDLGGGIRIDKTVHDFGDVLLSDGPLGCDFTVTNTGSKPIAIYNVSTSCGCTGVTWTREPVQPGKTGNIHVIYQNEDGPYPFEKTLTVYFSSLTQPVVLRLKGVASEKKLSLEEAYPERAGQIGFKETVIKAGNLRQEQKRSGEFTLANLGKNNATVSFRNVSPGLVISSAPNPVGGKKTAKATWTITADRSRWGKNHYYAEVVVNGSPTEKKLDIWAMTGENFTGWTDAQKKNASLPEFKTSSFSMNKFKTGTQFDAEFDFTNEGKSDFIIYKADSDSPNATLTGTLPKVAPGGKGKIRMHINTSGLPKGETLIIVSLTTNCPSRPLINLFITGWAE